MVVYWYNYYVTYDGNGRREEKRRKDIVYMKHDTSFIVYSIFSSFVRSVHPMAGCLMFMCMCEEKGWKFNENFSMRKWTKHTHTHSITTKATPKSTRKQTNRKSFCVTNSTKTNPHPAQKIPSKREKNTIQTDSVF